MAATVREVCEAYDPGGWVEEEQFTVWAKDILKVADSLHVAAERRAKFINYLAELLAGDRAMEPRFLRAAEGICDDFGIFEATSDEKLALATLNEIDDLPTGAVIKDAAGNIYQAQSMTWSLPGDTRPYRSCDLERPVTVLDAG